MNTFLDALDTFVSRLEAVEWRWLGIAIGLHLCNLLLRTLAWRNILAASYPATRVRWRTTLGAYVAGVGLNAVLPARSGDLLKIFLVRRGIEGGSVPTIVGSLIVETLLDLVLALGLVAWALSTGELPGLSLLRRLPSVDWGWPLRHPTWGWTILGIALVALLALAIWGVRRVRAFWQRFGQGFAILRTPGRYLRTVVSLQALAWCFRLAAVGGFLEAFRLHRSIHDVLVVQSVTSISTVVPITPGGAGTQQGLLAYVLSGRYAKADVLSFSVGMNIALAVVNLTLAVVAILLMLRTLRWRRHLAEHDAPVEG